MKKLPTRLAVHLLALALLCVSAPAQPVRADLVILNANIHTMDEENPLSEAVAVKNGRIIAVGQNEKIKRLIGARTRTIDARGRLVLPGFNDSHTHILGIGNLFTSIDLRRVTSPAEITNKIAYFTRFLRRGRWILGGGWNEKLWPSRELPTRELIDAVSPLNPVLIYNADASMALANSRALEIAGIDKDRGDIHDGKIVKDAKGRPTGLLKGKAVMMVKILTKRTPFEEKLQVIETASNYAASYGITSLQDMSTDDNFKVIRELVRRGRLKTRIYECSALKNWRELADKGVKHSNGSAMVRNGCVKSFSEGTPGTPPDLYKNILAADKAGLQVMIHAIGPRSNAYVLSLFRRAIKQNGPRDRRFRIEHAQRVQKRDIAKFGELGIIASMQPFLFYGSGPYRTLLEGGARIAFGSDASITDIDPLKGISVSVNPVPNEHSQRLTVEQAVRLYTRGSAYAEFQEELKGAVRAGMLADLIILSDDIFKMDASSIKNVKVLTTILGGKIVFQRRGGDPPLTGAMY